MAFDFLFFANTFREKIKLLAHFKRSIIFQNLG